MSTQQNRILSIDALRGFDMFWILGVDVLAYKMYEASANPLTEFFKTQMTHVEWTGFRFYDLIMPLFLFIVGAVLPFSVLRRAEKGESKKKIYLHIFKRVVILWIFGMMVQGNLLTYDIHKIKIYSNTLQAIASGYLIASVIILSVNKKRIQLIFCLLLLLIYWGCVALIPVPGYKAGIMTPQVNLPLYIDKLLFGSMQDGTTYSWVLSSLNFAATTLLGVFAGYIIKAQEKEMRKFWKLLFTGIALILVALLWHPFHLIVKHIWTSSFVLFSGGLSFLLLALFYLIIDVWKFQRWTFPFIVIGSNAILAYMISHLFGWRMGAIANIVLGGLAQWTGPWQPALETAGGIALIYGILYYCYKKKIFLKV